MDAHVVRWLAGDRRADSLCRCASLVGVGCPAHARKLAMDWSWIGPRQRCLVVLGPSDRWKEFCYARNDQRPADVGDRRALSVGPAPYVYNAPYHLSCLLSNVRQLVYRRGWSCVWHSHFLNGQYGRDYLD